MSMGRDGEPAETASAEAEAISTVTYEQLADLETDFDNVDLQLCELDPHNFAESGLQVADTIQEKIKKKEAIWKTNNI